MFFMAYGLDGALVGFITSGFFISVLYYPFFWINFAMTAALYNAAIKAFAPERVATRNRASLRRGPIVDSAASVS
jgi:hypothetical protein